LGSTREQDLSRHVWKRKHRSWQRADLAIVTPSHWMARQAASSALLAGRRIEVIPNCLDTEVFRPGDRQAARRALGLPLDQRILMFGALTAEGDRRKGFHLLAPALKWLVQGERADTMHLAVLGMSPPTLPAAFPIAVSFLGILERERAMAQAYCAADVFVAPSIEDNLPNSVMEALACGVPCVAFDVGGMPDLIDHQQNGYLARSLDPEDLARGVAWVLEDAERSARLREQARRKVLERFAPKVVAGQHLALYTDVIAAKGAPNVSLPLR
jgi:glycosyltransferase involved in cell wall biosynthesis